MPGSRVVSLVAVVAALVLGSRRSSAQTWEAPAEAKNIKSAVATDAKTLEKGKKLFKQNCVPCHGDTGRGDGAMGKAMGIKPGNLTNRQRMTAHSDGEIFWKVSKGKDPMPVFERKLSERERWDLVSYVRTLAK